MEEMTGLQPSSQLSSPLQTTQADLVPHNEDSMATYLENINVDLIHYIDKHGKMHNAYMSIFILIP